MNTHAAVNILQNNKNVLDYAFTSEKIKQSHFPIEYMRKIKFLGKEKPCKFCNFRFKNTTYLQQN